MKKKLILSNYTIAGLVLSLLGSTLVLSAFQYTAPVPLTNFFIVIRELSLFILAGILIFIVIKGEKLSLESIGLHNNHWGKSILWSFILMLIFIVGIMGCLGVFSLLGITYGDGPNKYSHLSLWVITFMMLRAGIVEEIFFRGYAMERLNKINSHWIIFIVIPTTMFGLAHYRQGIGGVIIALVGGLIMSLFYWKKRDLKANIIAHFMVDFIPNVLIPLITDK